MSGYFHSLRKDNLIRPADPDKPVYSGWRDLPPESDWKRQSAIQSPNTERTRKQHKPVKPAVPKPTVCTQDGCSERIYKASLCKEHYDNVVRERNRAARARRREREKALAKERAEQNKRPCNVCGNPVPVRFKTMLCREHITAYREQQASERRKKKEAESDRIKEETRRRNDAILDAKWKKIQARYEQKSE